MVFITQRCFTRFNLFGSTPGAGPPQGARPSGVEGAHIVTDQQARSHRGRFYNLGSLVCDPPLRVVFKGPK